MADKVIQLKDSQGNNLYPVMTCNINELGVADYVIDKYTVDTFGTSGWKYEKWASGKLVARAKKQFTGMAVTTSANGQYVSSTLYFANLPTEFTNALTFDGFDSIQVSGAGGGSVSAGVKIHRTTFDSDAVRVTLSAPTSLSSVNYPVNMTLVGTWK